MKKFSEIYGAINESSVETSFSIRTGKGSVMGAKLADGKIVDGKGKTLVEFVGDVFGKAGKSVDMSIEAGQGSYGAQVILKHKSVITGTEYHVMSDGKRIATVDVQ